MEDWDFHLVLVEFAVLVLHLALVLEGYDDEPDEDVDHEERDDDDVDEEENGDPLAVIIDRTVVLLVRVDASIHQPAKHNSPCKWPGYNEVAVYV